MSAALPPRETSLPWPSNRNTDGSGNRWIEVGNITPTAEFNMWFDPEAPAIVFAATLPNAPDEPVTIAVWPRISNNERGFFRNSSDIGFTRLSGCHAPRTRGIQ